MHIYDSPIQLAKAHLTMMQEAARAGRPLPTVDGTRSPVHLWARPILSLYAWGVDWIDEMVQDERMCAHLRIDGVDHYARWPTVLEIIDGTGEDVLHCTTGPAVAFPGLAFWFLHGIKMSKTQHKKITSGRVTVMDMLNCRNFAVAGLMAQLVDWSDVATAPDRRLIDESKWGRLWLLTSRYVPGHEQARREYLVVEVQNSTAEPDGSYKTYWLRVDIDCRPLLDDRSVGMIQTQTALNAIASTFGLTGEEYERNLIAQS